MRSRRLFERTHKDDWTQREHGDDIAVAELFAHTTSEGKRDENKTPTEAEENEAGNIDIKDELDDALADRQLLLNDGSLLVITTIVGSEESELLGTELTIEKGKDDRRGRGRNDDRKPGSVAGLDLGNNFGRHRRRHSHAVAPAPAVRTTVPDFSSNHATHEGVDKERQRDERGDETTPAKGCHVSNDNLTNKQYEHVMQGASAARHQRTCNMI